ncbi:MAG TPA: 3-deoxy-D-manno-octulosonic acid transferase [Gammaproteobacteria bacterium]|jgi:3-deoxy-D-manno-octulosonic-acid transferase|nr:3-deoxy-D-manno-octulosonic acid transferase [Gammaproteobacteria bacterium]
MRLLYTLALLLLAPFAFAWFAWRGFRQTGSADKLGERLGSSPYLPPGVAIWVHGASVGEIRAAAPLVQSLHRKYPDRPLLVTTFTATGRRQARQLFGDRVVVSLMPYDLSFFVNRFLQGTRPAVGVVMETEIWPNLYAGCDKRKIPLLLVSARMSERAFTRYSDWKFRGLIRGALRRAKRVAAQTEADAARFRALGAPEDRLSVMGNLKFDVQAGADLLETGKVLRHKLFGKAGVLVAGSTREGEEPILLDAFRKLLATRPDSILVLAPRHPERANAVAAAISAAGFGFRRLSAGETPIKAGEVLLIDVLGQLMKFYAAGDAAFVGGTLVPVGGHNLLEPAAAGLPVLAGPHLANVQDVAEMLKDAGVLTPVSDADTVAAAAAWLLGNDAMRHSIGELARGKVLQNRGALERALGLVSAELARR